MESTQLWLGLYIFSFGIGGVLIGSLTLTRLWTQTGLAILLALCGFALLHSDESSKPIFGDALGWDFFIFVAIAVGALWLAKGLWKWWKAFAEILSQALQPGMWTSPPTPLSSVDNAKRWFVTVAAATGSLAFTLAATPEFQTLVFSYFASPYRLVMTALITIGSLVLIGPVEEFIFSGLHGKDAGAHEDQRPAHFERIIQTMSWRALGRILLVFLMILALNVAHSCLEEQLKDRDSSTTLVVVLSTITPAVITYFWCGALQTGAPQLAAVSTIGAVAAGMLLFLPMMVLAVFNELASGANSNPGLTVLVEPLVFAFLMGAVLVGLPALCGGLILSIARRSTKSAPLRTIAFIVITLSLLNTALLLVLVGYLALQGTDFAAAKVTMGDLIAPGIASTVGWGAGLLVSGFPDIVRRAPAPVIAPPAAAPAPPAA